MTILGIWAHPDDEVFVSGGLMANAARRGEQVVCIHMTRGEAGLYYGGPGSPETLARVRERELKVSLAHLGVAEQRFLGYPDGQLARVPSEGGVGRIYAALEELQPDVVLTFGPDGFTGHLDHKVLSGWVTSALKFWNRPVQLLHAAVTTEWTDAFVPALNEFDFFWPGYPVIDVESDVMLRLDDELLRAKLTALRAHASQMTVLFDSYGDGFVSALASAEYFRDASMSLAQRPRGSVTPPTAGIYDLHVGRRDLADTA